jgi:hypothetical protein
MVCSNCKQTGHTNFDCSERFIHSVMSVLNTGTIQIYNNVYEIKDGSGRIPNHPDFDLFTKINTDFPESSPNRVTIGVDGINSCDTYMRNYVGISQDHHRWKISTILKYVRAIVIFEKSGISYATNTPKSRYIPVTNRGTQPRKKSELMRPAFLITRDAANNVYEYTTADVKESELRSIMDKQFNLDCVIFRDYLFVANPQERARFNFEVNRLRQIERHLYGVALQRNQLHQAVSTIRSISANQDIPIVDLLSLPNPPLRNTARLPIRPQLCVVSEKAYESDDCPICRECIGETNKCVLRCGHQYCSDCIFAHFQEKNGSACPTCRVTYAIKK